MTEHILVAYFSHSGTTRKIADIIHQEVDGVIYEMLPEMPYPNSYHETVDQAKREIRAGYHPPLQSSLDHIESYNMVFIGTPNWWSTIAPPVATFLSEYDLSGKTIAPFCTHGGGGLGGIDKDIAKLCPHSSILSSLTIYGSGTSHAQTDVSAWLYKIGLKH